MNYFNSQGVINASNVKDALTTITKLASILQDGVPSNFSLANTPGYSDEHLDALVARALYDNQGKVALAQAMANPKLSA